ncbi:TauD/TfdA family dioxygenase [Myxococcota bacterium]|nr:TauD/TfdA family dioxygenase [Myxococcota bacterium]
MPESRVQIEKISGALGAELRGLDLADGLEEQGLESLERAILDHHVVFLRNQPLSDEAHLALARRFGEVSVYPILAAMGSDVTLEVIEDTENSAPKADHWHTDVTWIPEPPKLAFLSACEIPAYGGDTLWVSLHAAYDALSPALQERIDGLRVFHDAGDEFWDSVAIALGDEQVAQIRKQVGSGAEHPLVRTHPATGRKALFVASFMQHIVGMYEDESRMLLDFLMAHACKVEFQCRWRWQRDDLAIWDERCTMHRALGDHYPQRRRVRRCTVDGDRPYFEPEAHVPSQPSA